MNTSRRYQWIAPAVVTMALAAFVVYAKGYVMFPLDEAPPRLVTQPNLGPYSLIVAGGAVLLASLFWRRVTMRLDLGALLPLALAAGIVMNTGWWPPRFPRVPGDTLADLYTMPQDAFGNMGVYVRIAEQFPNRRVVIDAETLEQLQLIPWELQAYGRVGAVEVAASPPAVSDTDVARLLALPHRPFEVQALGTRDGKYFSFIRKLVLIPDEGGDGGAVTVFTHGDRTFIVPLQQVTREESRE